MAPSFQGLMYHYERWVGDAKYLAPGCSDDRDVRPLVVAAIDHLRSHPDISEVAPCWAVFYFAVDEYECVWFKRLAVLFACWLFRHVPPFRGRAMWNDFWMALWQLSRDPRYIGRLHSHLKRANPIQKSTGAWMIGSVCQQDSEFGEHWRDVVKERGEVFG